MTKKITAPLVALAAFSAFALGACNTVEGVGEDVQTAGETIEETAKQTNDGNPRTP
ncbi:MAG: entericidin A/B family lipoprotein [Phycisphaerales bacterium]|nr:entericidin A/B family lipoprotein [Hyphomonadaceae bacterium]